VLRQALNKTRKFGIVSIIGVHGGFVVKVPTLSA
jgi:threonine dehydrogenase-like Zn-dependent dehydrogenase